MEDTKWLEVTLTTTPDDLERVTARLTANGITGLEIEDEADFRRFLEQNRQYWDYVDEELERRMAGACRVKFYVTDDGHGREQMARWLVGLEDLPRGCRPLAENDWATSWQKYYVPIPVGEKLYIVPEWQREEEVPPGRVPLYLNPGLTFGTGNHASTQLCLTLLEKYCPQGEDVLDLGCGSGILSIAALALGAGKAVGVDIDPKAVDVAYENAAMNGIGRDRYTVLAGDVIQDKSLARDLAASPAPLVMANIVADVIIALSPRVRELMTAEGVFLCSGIIDSRAAEVEEALARQGRRVTDRAVRKGWLALAARLA